MSISVTFRGVNYTLPEPGDAFTQAVTDFFNSIGTNLGTSNPFLEATAASGQSIPNNVATIVVFGTVVTDTDTAYNSGTGRYTVPAGKGGRYLVTATIQWNGPGVGAGSNNFSIAAFKNAAQVSVMDSELFSPGTTFATLNSLAGSALITCVAGDILDVRALQNTGGAVTFAGANRLTIMRLQA